mgnify:CR=1 FL=1
MSKTFIVTVELQLPASAQAVFDAWLDPQQVRHWMSAALRDMGLSGDMKRVEIDPVTGGRFTFSDQREEGEAVHWGTYRQIDRPCKLVWTWFTSPEEEALDASLVSLEITPAETGCRAQISHRLAIRWQDYAAQVEHGWRCLLRHSGQLHEKA